MLHRAALALLLAFASLLASCGGGGGGDSAPPYQLSFSPGTLATTYAQGSSQTVSVTATLDRTVSQTVNVAIVDSAGVIEPTVQLTALTPTSYQATLTAKSTLSVGEHVGSLKVHLCYDNPAICNTPLPGSPFSLPYTFTVTAPVVVPAAQVTPAAITVDAYLDAVPNVQLSASLTGAGGYPQIVDPAGAFQPNPYATSANGANLTYTLFPSASLTAGTHNGNLEFRVCKDQACTQQVAGSPVLVPYSLVLRAAASNLPPLSRTAGAGEWAQYQANAAHTGYVPMTLDASKFNRRWQWTLPVTNSASTGIQPLVTSAGSLYVVTSHNYPTTTLYALSEHDKSTRWTRDFGSVFAANPPSTDAGMLYMATSGSTDTYMWGIEGASGALHFRTPFGSQGNYYLAPTIANGSAYTNGGQFGGLLSFKTADGSQNWFARLPQYDQWTPAVDSQYAYVLMYPGLNVFDAITGAPAFVITAPTAQQPYSVFGAPMIVGAGNVVVINGPSWNGTGNNSLLSFDIPARTLKWSVPGLFTQAPAFAKGVIYTVNGARLEARSDADGSLLWSWFPFEAKPFDVNYGEAGGNIIVTDNLIFVSSNTQVYALDLGTHQTVWTFPKPGQLALSPNGVLYITTPATADLKASIYAINLN